MVKLMFLLVFLFVFQVSGQRFFPQNRQFYAFMADGLPYFPLCNLASHLNLPPYDCFPLNGPFSFFSRSTLCGYRTNAFFISCNQRGVMGISFYGNFRDGLTNNQDALNFDYSVFSVLDHFEYDGVYVGKNASDRYLGPSLRFPLDLSTLIINSPVQGTLPPLKNFASLKNLYLAARISGDWTTPPKLTSLFLSGTELKGDIASLEKLSKFHLVGNSDLGIEGSDFSLSYNLTSFTYAYNVPAKRFPFPGDFARLTLLTFLYLVSNDFNSPLPPFPPNLEKAILKGNNLKGQIPPLSLLNKLTYLNCESNEFTGTIPLLPPSLTFLSLSVNNLVGGLSNLRIDDKNNPFRHGRFILDPNNVFSWTVDLIVVDNTGNLNVFVPGVIDNSTTFKLTWVCSVFSNMTVRKADLTGTISVGGFRNLTINGQGKLDTYFQSCLDPEIRTMFVRTVDLSYNQLSGTIIPFDPVINSLDLSFNRFSGTMPNFFPGTVYVNVIGNFLKIPDNFKIGESVTEFTPQSYFRYTSPRPAPEYNVVIKDWRLKPQDRDDCADGTHSCHTYAVCSDGLLPKFSYTCKCRTGYDPLASDPLPNQTCLPKCGDSLLVRGEVCEPLLTIGCTTTCRAIRGYQCDSRGQCRPKCGDGLSQLPETCDDGNLEDGDGCTKDCQIEAGYVCPRQGELCSDINECSQRTLHNCTRDDQCVNTIGSYYCCTANETNVNQTCENCFSPWVPISEVKINPFPFLQKYPMSYKSCLGACDSGQRFYSRRVASPACGGETTQSERCAYPCTNLTSFTTATAVIETLHRELEADNFIEEVFLKLFNCKISLFGSQPTTKRQANSSIPPNQLNVFLSPCPKDLNQAKKVFNQIVGRITPNAPSLEFHFTGTASRTGCYGAVISTDPPSSKTFAILAVVAAIVLIILIGLILYYKFKRRPLLDWSALPSQVAWSYKKFEESPGSWDYRGTKTNRYHFVEWDASSKEYAKVKDMFCESLGGRDFVISKVTGLYNFTLLSNFIGAKKIMDERLKNSPGIFASQQWRHLDEDDDIQKSQREWVYSRYQQTLKNFQWNSDATVAVLPALHGTDIGIAEKISQTGFAALSSIDAGFYGKGIYFTSHAMYSLPYISSQQPVIIISWIIPGNVFPVIEHSKGPRSLMGSALKPGYTAHFIATDPAGHPALPGDTEVYDEWVIAQESQIAPAFFLTLEKNSTGSLARRWRASIAARPPRPSVSEGTTSMVDLVWSFRVADLTFAQDSVSQG